MSKDIFYKIFKLLFLILTRVEINFWVVKTQFLSGRMVFY